MSSLRRIILLSLLAASGCRSRTADLGMSDSAFVKVMAELKVVADAPDVASDLRAQRREAVLRRNAVTADQIEKLSGTLTAHPQHAKRLWSAIETKAFMLARPNRKM